jgi:putative lipoic acid-binding regulatory protein
MADSDPIGRARALLLAHHQFPGPFEFRVVVRPVDRSAVVSAVAAAGRDRDALVEIREQPSARGTYLSLRLTLRVESADHVLEVYDVVRQVSGVLTVM